MYEDKQTLYIQSPRPTQHKKLLAEGTPYLVQYQIEGREKQTLAVSPHWLTAMRQYQISYKGPLYDQHALCNIDTRDNQVWVRPIAPHNLPYINLKTGQTSRLKFRPDPKQSGTLDF